MSPLSAFCFSLLLLVVPGGARAQAPDLTQNMTPGDCAFDFTYSYNLGPTGLRGWIYVQGGYGTSYGPPELMTAAPPWQILVTAVGANTPASASGLLAINDVILGVSTGSGNLPVPQFTHDARKSMGWAIVAAEAGDGWMNLKRWRAGATNDVSIRLPLQGLAYSATAPYNCPKSAVILSNACNIITNRAFNQGTPGDQVLGLALLASGNTNYLPKVQTYARSLTGASSGLVMWDWGYDGIFLSEYYLKTGDTNVLPVLNTILLNIANGTDRFGTVCHNPSYLNADGSYNGTACGYGPVNQVGLAVDLGLVMGKKCLVAAGMTVDPAIDAAITRATNFFGWHVQKGEIQYGEHNPWGAGYHASNGKHGLATLLFAMTGDQPVATEYWTRMTVAGYAGREYGHTGQGFSYLWEGLGANVGGTNAMGAYMSNICWHLDLERRCDGSFVYDGGEQYGPSQLSDYWAVGGNNTYDGCGLDPTATYVLTYAVPLQQIYLTGRNANPTNVLSSDVVTNAIWAGMFPQACINYTTNQLIAALGEYDPDVRFWAALQLGTRSGVSVSSMTNLAGSTNAWLRASACTVLGALANTGGLTALGQCLSDADVSVRAHATLALGNFGSSANPLVPTMLAAFTNNATDPNVINWNDPVQEAESLLSTAIFGDDIGYVSSVGGNNTEAAAKNLLYSAVRVGLKLPDSVAREDTAAFLRSYSTLADVQALAPDLIQCATTPVQADPMWRDGGRRLSIETLAKYQCAEAVPVAMAMLNPPWNSLNQGDAPEDDSPNAALNALATFGDSVRWTLPALNNYLNAWGATSGRFSTLVSAIATISAAVTSPTTITNLFAVANPQVVATTNAKPITLSGFSCRTNTVSFLNVTAPAHGALTGTAPNLTYTPNSGYTGLDSFTFQVADSMTNSAPATVSLILGTPPGTGLLGSYYTNVNFTALKFTRTDPQVNFAWGSSAPTNGMARTNYSVRWTGLLLAPETASYMFSTLNSDGVNLYVNGVQVVSDWMNQALQWTDGASVALTAGQQYVVQMDYYEQTGNAVAKLKWTGPSFGGSNGVIIAQQWLYTGSGVTNWPAIAYPQSVTLLQNTNVAITLEGVGNPTYAIATSPAHGTLSGTPPNVTYTPATNYSGTDSFTFTVNNGLSNSAPATVSIAIWAGLPVSLFRKNAASDNWSVAANWTNSTGASVAPGATGQPFYSLNFNPSGTYSVTNDLNNGFLLNQLTVAGAVTFAGASAPAFTANGPILPQINQNSGNGVTFNCPLNLAAMTTLGGTGNGMVTVNSLISGAGALTMNSLARLQITSAANTYSGGTVINNGTIYVSDSEDHVTPPLGFGPVTLNSSATLLCERVSVTNALTLNGGTINANNGFGLQFNGPVNLNSNVTTTGYETFFNGNISGGGGFIIVGGSALCLSGSNSFTGANYVTAGTLICNNAGALGTGPLTIWSNASVSLNYTGTRQIAALTFYEASGIYNQPYGTYGSTSSTAANKDSHFAGTGTVTVSPPTGSLTNLPASSISSSSAVVNAALTCNGATYAVTAYWNTIDAGTNAALWTNSAYVGAWTNVASTNLSRAVSSLAPGTTYFFTFRATNAAYTVWAPNVASFTTLPLAGPGVDNANGATNLSIGVAQLRGTLSNGPADVRLYWGTTDGGTNPASWGNTNLLTATASGAFSSNVSNLLYGPTYYYRNDASNQWGTAWAPATTNFTTLRPASSLANAAATGVGSTAAALKATLACAGAVYDVVAYWNTVNGGTDPVLWTNSAYVGSWTNAFSTNLSYTATGLLPSTGYYFTFCATNALATLWATNVQSFTTLAVLPPTPALPLNGVKLTNGVPSFSFTAAAGCQYRLDYKNGLTDAVWTYGPWSTNSSDSPLPMTLSDPSAAGQSQRFYRLEAAYP